MKIPPRRRSFVGKKSPSSLSSPMKKAGSASSNASIAARRAEISSAADAATSEDNF